MSQDITDIFKESSRAKAFKKIKWIFGEAKG